VPRSSNPTGSPRGPAASPGHQPAERPAPHADPGAATIRAAADGDRAALHDLLEPEAGRLYAVCLRMLGDAVAAEDASQEALIRIIRSVSGFDRRSRFSTWTTRIAMNVCLTRLRERKRRDRHAPKVRIHAGASARGEPEADERVQDREQRRAVLSALDALSNEHRAVLVLRDVRGMDHEQIGAVLGLPVGTVKSRVFRARAALRGLLESGSWDRKGRHG
jgi:RNA polymerase sigma-70 factor (ECF subfamily)